MSQNPKFYKTKLFLELNNLWQDKLKADGFKDIEDHKYHGQHLKDEGISNFKREGSFNHTRFDASELYYRLAGQFLYSHKFDSPLEEYIWKMHSNGVSIRQIIKSSEFLALYGKTNGEASKRITVNNIIKALKFKMYEEKKQEIANEQE